jgi:anaphase-promoting complex subunit 5
MAAALAALEFACRKFSMVAKSRVRAVQLQLVHDQALHRGKIKLAQVACGELSSLASPALGVDMELKTEAAFCHTRSFLASGHLDEVVTFSLWVVVYPLVLSTLCRISPHFLRKI